MLGRALRAFSSRRRAGDALSKTEAMARDGEWSVFARRRRSRPIGDREANGVEGDHHAELMPADRQVVVVHGMHGVGRKSTVDVPGLFFCWRGDKASHKTTSVSR